MFSIKARAPIFFLSFHGKQVASIVGRQDSNTGRKKVKLRKRKMKTKLLISSLLALLAIAVVCSAFRVSPVSFAYTGTNIYVDPPLIVTYTNETSIGANFTVSLGFGNMTDLAGIEYKLYWRNDTLAFAGVHDHLPWSGSPFIATNATTLDVSFNATHHYMYFVAASLSGGYSGSSIFRNATFTIINAPGEGNSLETAISYGDYGTETVFGDSTATLIPDVVVHNGDFIYTWVIPEYSSALVVFIFAVVTLLAAMVYKKKSVR
jgi:uncharacterized integral membrane protein